MSDYDQSERPIQITIDGVADDGVMITGLSGVETLSRLFAFTCDLSVPVDSPLAFKQLLGKPVVVSVFQEDGQWRYLRGLFCRVSETGRTDRFAQLSAELVPPLWLLTRNRRSRLFQHLTTEDILRDVLGQVYDLGESFKLEGTYHPRNICAQYHESDFEFVSRLMEEEGWYYYFTHTDAKHGLVVSDNPRGHRPVPFSPQMRYEPVGTATEGGRVISWTKTQELRTASFTLTDHSFEMPPNTLEVVETLSGSVAVGTVDHPLAAEGDATFDVTTHPGGYVRWRDGIAPGGAERPDDLKHVFEDNKRLVRVRLEEELAGAIQIAGASSFAQLTPGHTFTLTDHPDADGDYLVTSVRHDGAFGAATSGAGGAEYRNTFTCVPAGVTYRPARETRKPAIHGTQTAVVVGSDDAEIDPDKYGRVKVWFRWDPAGPRGLESSCWVRVATPWAGKQWGMVHIPRVGDEVVVAFEDGDPDRPLIVGSLWNADNMPIYKLPENKTQSGIKTHSSTGGTSQNFNEIKFEDKKGSELVSIHAEKDMSVTVEDNQTLSVGHNQTNTVGTDPKGDPRKDGTCTTTIFGDTKTTITKGDYYLNVAEGKSDTQVMADTTVTIHKGNHTFTVETGVVTEVFKNRQETTVKGNIDLSSTEGDIKMTADSKAFFLQAQKELKITSVADNVNVYAEKEIKLVCGSSSLSLKKDGTIVLKGVKVTVEGTSTATVCGPEVDMTGDKKAVLGVSGQTVKCDPSAVAIAGAMVKSAASGVHEITGALVKIN